MFQSDSEGSNNSDDQKQFVCLNSKPKFFIPKGIDQQRKIIEKSNKIKIRLLKQCLKAKAKTIMQFVFQNINPNTSNVVPVKFKRNQCEDLSYFVNQLEQCILEKDIKDSNLNIFMLKNTCKDFKELIGKVLIDIKGIQKIHRKAIVKPSIIILATQMTNLQEQNLYLFEKVLKDYNYNIIIPVLTQIDENFFIKHMNSKLQFSFHNIYDNKRLFCQFVYYALQDQILTPYFSQNILQLISDYDYYYISYRQGVRRFVYCIQRLKSVRKQKSLQPLQFVKFKPVINVINKVFKMSFRGYLIDEINYEKIVRCIYNPNEIFTIPNSFINRYVALKSLDHQNNCIQSLREQLIKQFEEKNLSQYIQIFNNKNINLKDLQIAKLKPKKDRANQLGFTTLKSVKTQKQILQAQISYSIRKATQNLTKQSKQIRWDQLLFEKRIKPQIMKQIVNGFKTRSKMYEKLVNFVTSFNSVTIDQIVGHFIQDNLIQGQVPFMLEDLQICHIIERNTKSAKLSYKNNYYQTATMHIKKYQNQN